ncbi:MAG TPA: transposase [Actinocrinis sp.]|uniref:transposase n=1 Tax=Actinocrinis sp. TaxID=1920516 RepID=UPI002DDD6911|nr:transposase [Actinocrinis sp.]HEV3171095.1 transposase [Actinocrinis sp.]
MNAVVYQNRTGCQWDLLPHDFPPPSTVYDYFSAGHDDGTDRKIHDLLRRQVRRVAGRAGAERDVRRLPVGGHRRVCLI